MRLKDKIEENIITIVSSSCEPLETKEVEDQLPTETRTKVLYRLRDLQGKGIIKGKMVGAGKGTWIWWNKESK